MTRAEAERLVNLIQSALMPVCGEDRRAMVVLETATGRGATYRVELVERDREGRFVTANQREVSLYGAMYGIQYGDRFRNNTWNTFEVIGWNRNAERYFVQARRVRDGRIFRFEPRMVQSGTYERNGVPWRNETVAPPTLSGWSARSTSQPITVARPTNAPDDWEPSEV